MEQILFGKIIKKMRTDKGLSQESFSLSIGMDRSYYASVEVGRRNISLKNMVKISKGLQIPLSKIFVELEREINTGDLFEK